MSVSGRVVRYAGLVAALVAGTAFGTPFSVVVDTSSLAPGYEAVIAFDLNNADSTVASQVTISGFASDGTLLVCPVPDTCAPPDVSPDIQPIGADVTGTLPGTVTIRDTDVGGIQVTPITYYQNILLGSSIKFTFEMLGDPGSGEFPDGFDLVLLDALTGIPLLAGPEGILFLFSVGQGCTSFSEVTSCEAVASVPEPRSLALVAVALFALAALRRRRIRQEAPDR